MSFDAALYRINEFSVETSPAFAEVTLNPEHPVFKGHFPGQPVLPGVVFLEITEALVSRILGKEVCISEATRIKYLHPVNPNQDAVLTFKLELTPEQQDIAKALVQASVGEQVCFKFAGKLL